MILEGNETVVSIYNDQKSSILGDVHTSISSGVFISCALILCCAHGLSKRKNIRVSFNCMKSTKITVNCDVVFLAKKWDLAMLLLPDNVFVEQYLPFQLHKPDIGEECEIVCRHEKGSPYKVIVSAHENICGDTLHKHSLVVKGPELPQGTSGCPLVVNGAIAGLHHYGEIGEKGDKALSLCLKSSVILAELTKWLTKQKETN